MSIVQGEFETGNILCTVSMFWPHGKKADFINVHNHIKTLTHVAKCPKGLSCFEKQTAELFLK